MTASTSISHPVVPPPVHSLISVRGEYVNSLPRVVIKRLPDTITTPFLDSLGFIINTVHHTLICMTCKISVNHGAIRLHFKSKRHKLHNPKAEVQQQIRMEIEHVYPRGLIYPPNVPNNPVEAVYGLADPLHKYVRCSHCM